MKRLHLYLPLKLVIKIKKAADVEGIPVSEVIRRILSAHFG
jgi:predicted DNA binding CopG/RHH family protein